MELLNNPQIHSTFASLGNMQGETYVPNEDCNSFLEEITCKLLMEDHTLRTYRRAIGFGQNVRKDIMPILINVKDPQILDNVVRLMVYLTVPIECLLSVEVMSRTEIGRHTIYELNRLLYTSKEVFVDIKATKAITDYMKSILEADHKLSPSQCESVNNCLLLLRNILHIPECLYQGQPHASMQNQILWNLFTQSIDKLLIHLMSSPQKSSWGVTIVQLIALMYKDQHVGTFQKLLNHWFEAISHSESSEDNESNTSPPKECVSGDSSPMLTSDPTSDSSDNNHMTLSRTKPKSTSAQNSIESILSTSSFEVNEYCGQDITMKSPERSASSSPSKISSNKTQKARNQPKNQKHCSQQRKTFAKQQNYSSELSDCGYRTQTSQGEHQVDNKREANSNSSNDDDGPKPKPTHQKPSGTNQKQRFNAAQKQRNANAANTPAGAQDKKEERRKKLVKRSKSSIINMKGLIHHMPTDDDISNILKEFTVDFLLKGYGFLVQELHVKLLTDTQISIDTSHFFWLVTYFLKFAAQLELDLVHISSVLSFEVISYLTFEGVNLCEQLELTSRQRGTDIKPYLRRIHLVVTAIREFLHALEIYKKSSHLSTEDKHLIDTLRKQIASTVDLRHLFVLLLRCYNPTIQSHQYLQDLVVTNHVLLLLLDNVSKQSESRNDLKILDHISQFATVDIMRHYGVLLENFRDNGEFVNDCIFTMMHHVGGDLNQVAILFQPSIIKTYSQIWETEYEICDDWSDLIEYVIHKFINNPPKPQASLFSPMMSDDVSIDDVWTQEEMDTLYWYFVQSKRSKDVIGSVTNLIKDSYQKSKSRIAVIQQLLQQDIISLVEFDDLMKFEDSQYEIEAKSAESPIKTESGIELNENYEFTVSNQPDDIKVLRDRLLKENKGNLLSWLQQVLIECCFVKLNLISPQHESIFSDRNHSKLAIMEPIPHHCILQHRSVPLVPFNNEQNKILVYQPFVLLLHKLGFHLPADANKLFVRIPDFWTADILLMTAEKLGPIPDNNLKFDISYFHKSKVIRNIASSPPAVSPTSNDSLFRTIQSSSSTNSIRYTPELTRNDRNWLQMVMQSKASFNESFMDSNNGLSLASSEASPSPVEKSDPLGLSNFLEPFSINKCQNSSKNDDNKHLNFDLSDPILKIMRTKHIFIETPKIIENE